MKPVTRFFALMLCLMMMAAVVPVNASSGKEAPAWPATETRAEQYASFPLPLDQYAVPAGGETRPLVARIMERAKQDPFNVWATVIFVCAILHTFAAGMFQSMAHHAEEAYHQEWHATGAAERRGEYADAPEPVSFKAQLFHYLGEVEAVFAIWAIPLLVAAIWFHGWEDAKSFVNQDCDFVEPLFVVVIMAVSASRPVVRFAEHCLAIPAIRLGGGSPAAWWLSVLTLAPLLGSLITEPAAMTISALLLARRFYELRPSKVFAYATLGLLFVNVSVGGVLTNFAAPPVLMVATKWNWSSGFMLQTFGSHAVVSILISNAVYFLVFRKEFQRLGDPGDKVQDGEAGRYWKERTTRIPLRVTLTHLAFLAWTVYTSHYPVFFLGGFLFFLGFLQASQEHQNPLSIKSPMLVGFFLAGLVIHGRCQSWWLEPVMNNGLGPWPLAIGAAVLTGFNDNALITFLASQVPGLTDALKYAVMTGAVAGGGLTVIANAPNPAGQGILKNYFNDRVNPLGLLAAALPPTVIVMLVFMLG
ncbi:MAG: putative Na+/H+ antiporter [Verrucomicrobia bacterium]|jgi:hypothetical protein|nr:MAG: putative Na+/H+ antiporter [Verrucomicrobiota bacterium]